MRRRCPPASGGDSTPDNVDEVDRQVRHAVETLAGFRAVGEIGLDYHYDYAPRELQQTVFRRQVALARDLSLPIVIHTREAGEDTVQILDEEGRGQVRGVFHCFTGNTDLARKALDLGFHISFSGIVTFRGAAEIREAAEFVPADRLVGRDRLAVSCPYHPTGGNGTSRRGSPVWSRCWRM